MDCTSPALHVMVVHKLVCYSAFNGRILDLHSWTVRSAKPLPFSLFYFITEIQSCILTTMCPFSWKTQTFVSTYINIPIFFMLYFGYKFIRGSQIITLSEIPIEHFLVIAEQEERETEKASTRWRWLTFLWE
jgi:amino acid permease